MPELPDLLYIEKHLRTAVAGKTINGVLIVQPVIIRNMQVEPFDAALMGKAVKDVTHHGPFLRFSLEASLSLVVNLMLAGRLQHQRPGEKADGYRCCSFTLDDGSFLHLCDEKKMAKVYLVHDQELSRVPRYGGQGIDILSPEFLLELLRSLAAKHSRKQVRVFINDQTILSAIGNAYADEILFDAGIHPKTFVGRLNADEIEGLFRSIAAIIKWGSEKVEEAAKPISVKVRDHMRVRNRKGDPCPRCGTTIRREGVRGHDVFFCPKCQPASRKLFIDWTPHH